MKLIKLTSIAGLMVLSTQVFSGVVDNAQIMPPPGPYQSIMNNTPPAFVPYGSARAQANPHRQNLMPQTFNHFPADTRSMIRPAVQPPEWVVNQQQAVKENIKKMLEENAEYLKRSEARAEKYEQENRKRIEENNKQMKETWKNMLDQYSKNQKQQIENAKNLPEWVKERMLKQHEYQVAMMNSNPPMEMYPPQKPMGATAQRQRNQNQQRFDQNRNYQGGFNRAEPNPNQHFMHPQMRPNMQSGMPGYQQRPMPMPMNRMQAPNPGMPPMQGAPMQRPVMQRPIIQGPIIQGQPFMGQQYPVAPRGVQPVAPYNNYRR